MTAIQKQNSAKDFFARADVQGKFQEMLGKRSTQFITSVLQIVNSNDMLKSADPSTIYQAAAVAATLDLPLNNNLGFAYIVPFKNTKANKVEAQFQLGYKGYIQLAMRSGQFRTINVSDVRKGEIKSENRLTGEIEFEWIASDERINQPVVGFVAYYELLNGFSKASYMSRAELEKHGLRFSQTYKKGFGLWKDDFESMASKTVLKLLLAKYAPLSVDMQTAVSADSSVVKNFEAGEFEYVDNTPTLQTPEEQEQHRITDFINASNSLEELEALDNVELSHDNEVLLFDKKTALKK